MDLNKKISHLSQKNVLKFTINWHEKNKISEFIYLLCKSMIFALALLPKDSLIKSKK